MKTFTVIVFVLFIHSSAFAEEFLFTMKDGASFTWSSYTEVDANYCTWKSSGSLCIAKNDVKSIKNIISDTNKDARVIVPPERTEAEKARDAKDAQKQESDRRWEEMNEKARIANERRKERLDRIRRRLGN